MEIFDKETLENVLRQINSGFKGRQLYPPGHPAIASSMKRAWEMISRLLEKENPLLMGRVEDVLVFGHHSFLESAFGEVLKALKDKGLEGISFNRGVTLDEFTDFFDMLFSDKKYDVDELRRELIKRKITHITIKFLPVTNKFLELYKKAVEVVKESMEQVRLGALPKTEAVMEIVEDMTDLVLEDKNAMLGLTMIKDYDNYLFTHSVNVSILALALADNMGIDKNGLRQIGIASLLHDIGKTGIGENIIKKPGKLSHDEWEKIKEHPILGYRIVERMDDMSEIPPRIVLEHHVKYDMTGYPEFKKWDKPHPYTMIVTIADTYDALTTLRTYQKPRDPVHAIYLMKSMAGKTLDPNLLKVFINMLGLYPVGTLVRLDTNEIGIIIKVNKEDNTKPVLKIIIDKDGNRLKKPLRLDLSKPLPEGVKRPTIVANIDPISKNINVEEYFKGASNF